MVERTEDREEASDESKPSEKWPKRWSRDMKVSCTVCGNEINLDHKVFENYMGPVKCFACSAILEVGTDRGFVYSVKPLDNVNPDCVPAARWDPLGNG